jgi:hypothetical protein
MNNTLRDEMIILMSNYEQEIPGDEQVKIIANCSKFVNNQKYMDEIKKALDIFFPSGDFNFWVELPKIINVVIDVNKNIDSLAKDIKVEHMKFIIYAIIYSYLDVNQSAILNKQDFEKSEDFKGNLRIGFLNILSILLIKSKNICVKKQSLFCVLLNCIFGDDGKTIHV